MSVIDQQRMSLQLPEQIQKRLNIPLSAITNFCQRWQISELALFGSVLRDDFHSDSDIDMLVSFQPEVTWGLLEFSQMKRELAALTNREVDLITRKSIEQSHNWIRQQDILTTSQIVYDAR